VIPAETLVELATLGLPKEQVERVAAMLKSVELATQEECGSAIASRRKADRERQQKHRSKSRDVTLANVTNVTERDTPPSREEYNTTRAPAVIPVGISNDIPPLVNPQSPTVITPTEKSKRAHRLPEDWSLPDDWRDAARRKGLSDGEISRQADRMLNWSRSAKNGAKLDWYRTWLNWIDDAPRANARAGPPRPPEKRNPVFQAFEEIMAERYGTEDDSEQSSDVFDGPTIELVADPGGSESHSGGPNGFARDDASSFGERVRHEGDAIYLRGTTGRFASG
jgi:hypothetical protein